MHLPCRVEKSKISDIWDSNRTPYILFHIRKWTEWLYDIGGFNVTNDLGIFLVSFPGTVYNGGMIVRVY